MDQLISAQCSCTGCTGCTGPNQSGGCTGCTGPNQSGGCTGCTGPNQSGGCTGPNQSGYEEKTITIRLNPFASEVPERFPRYRHGIHRHRLYALFGPKRYTR